MSRPRPTEPAARVVGALGCGYALGLIPSADMVTRRLASVEFDLREAGTGNPGALNAYRLLGRRAGVVVAVGDVAKGALACLAGRTLAGPLGAHLAGVAAVAGHCYPLTRRRRGGLGAATSFGQCLVTFPVYAPVDAAVAVAASKLAGSRRPAATALAVSSLAWVAAATLWWRRRLPNLWGSPPTAALPLANAATVAVIGLRALVRLRDRRAGEVRLR